MLFIFYAHLPKYTRLYYSLLFLGVTYSALTLDLMCFFGKLVGMSVRHNLTLGLNLPSSFWCFLVRQPVGIEHLAAIDVLFVNNIKAIESLGLQCEKEGRQGEGEGMYVPPEWLEMNFTTHRADGSQVELVPQGASKSLHLGNWREYMWLSVRLRLKESAVLVKAFRDGLGAVLPQELFSLFTASEMETLVTGSSKVSLYIDLFYLLLSTSNYIHLSLYISI